MYELLVRQLKVAIPYDSVVRTTVGDRPLGIILEEAAAAIEAMASQREFIAKMLIAPPEVPRD